MKYSPQSLLSRMRLGWRLAIAISVLVVPLFFLTYEFAQTKIEAVRIARLEADGLDYLLPLQEFITHVAEHRGMRNLYLHGYKAIHQQIEEVEKKIDLDLVRLEAEDARV